MAEQFVELDPAVVLAEDNTRFTLKPARVESMMASILEQGGILEPVEVAELDEPDKDGHTHRLTMGFVRHAAALKLNTDQGAGLLLPALVRPSEGVDRVKRQVAENHERENLTPMDKAVAMARLLKEGMSRADVRKTFASTEGGRKSPEPLSNAMLNIYLQMLQLPKSIQGKIHEGKVSISAAYQLSKVPADKRAAVLERAEAEIASQVEKDEAEEERYLSSQSKLLKAETEAEESGKLVAALRVEIEEAAALAKEKAKELNERLKAALVPGVEVSKQENEALKGLKKDVEGAQKITKDGQNKLAAALKKMGEASEKAEAVKAKMEDAAKPKAKPKAEVGAKEIKAAAAKEGEGGKQALTLSEFRQTLKDMIKVEGKIGAIAVCLTDHIDGGRTTKELIADLSLIMVGERRAAPVVEKAADKKKK